MSKTTKTAAPKPTTGAAGVNTAALKSEQRIKAFTTAVETAAKIEGEAMQSLFGSLRDSVTGLSLDEATLFLTQQEEAWDTAALVYNTKYKVSIEAGTRKARPSIKSLSTYRSNKAVVLSGLKHGVAIAGAGKTAIEKAVKAAKDASEPNGAGAGSTPTTGGKSAADKAKEEQEHAKKTGANAIGICTQQFANFKHALQSALAYAEIGNNAIAVQELHALIKDATALVTDADVAVASMRKSLKAKAAEAA